MEQFLAFWDQWHTPLRIVLILIGTVLVRWIALILVKRVIRGIEDGTRNHKNGKSDSPIAKARVVQRAKTMGSVLGNLITWTLILCAAGSVLRNPRSGSRIWCAEFGTRSDQRYVHHFRRSVRSG
jgi:hypothetical protein